MEAEKIKSWMSGVDPKSYFTTFAIYNAESVDMITCELGEENLPEDVKTEILKEFDENYDEKAMDMLWGHLTQIIKTKLKERK